MRARKQIESPGDWARSWLGLGWGFVNVKQGKGGSRYDITAQRNTLSIIRVDGVDVILIDFYELVSFTELHFTNLASRIYVFSAFYNQPTLAFHFCSVGENYVNSFITLDL